MRRWIIGSIVLGLAIIAFVSMRLSGGVPVEVATVRSAQVEAVVEELGKTRLGRTHLVSMPLNGRIMPIEFDVGTQVAAGEVVARLDSTALEAFVAEERARIARLDADIARNDDERLERSLIDQIGELIISLDLAVQSAEEQTRTTTAQLELATVEREELEDSAEGGAATERELRRVRVAEVEREVELRKSFLTLRSTQAVQTAISIGTRLVEQMIEIKALDRDVLESQRDEAEARLTRLEDDLARATLTSPVDGLVLARHEDSERVLGAGVVLLEIGSLDDLEIEIEMLTDEASRVSVGDRVEITWATTSLDGHVTRVEPRAFTKVSSLGVEQQRVIVVAKLDEPAPGLGVGFRVRTRVILDNAAALSLPRGAVFRDNGTWHAFVVRGGRARLAEVTVGLMNDEVVEVRSGVADGDSVIVAPGFDIRDNSRVRVVQGG